MYAKKSLGQNFLHDKSIIDKIVNSVETKSDDLIIEIGPGQGALTKHLKEKGSNLVAFEIDSRMHDYLDDIEDDKTHVIYGDFLNIDVKEAISDINYDNVYVIANLPYYITTPIIEKLLELDINIKSIVVMVQKEVADRFCASPKTKDYGYMTVLLNSVYDIKKLFIVKNTCFTPVPKVDSAVVRFDQKKVSNIFNVDKLRRIASLSFMHKRKTLKNNLPKDVWDKVYVYLLENDINLNVRAEELPYSVYIDFSNLI